jgi:hypothetical protein
MKLQAARTGRVLRARRIHHRAVQYSSATSSTAAKASVMIVATTALTGRGDANADVSVSRNARPRSKILSRRRICSLSSGAPASLAASAAISHLPRKRCLRPRRMPRPRSQDICNGCSRSGVFVNCESRRRLSISNLITRRSRRCPSDAVRGLWFVRVETRDIFEVQVSFAPPSSSHLKFSAIGVELGIIGIMGNRQVQVCHRCLGITDTDVHVDSTFVSVSFGRISRHRSAPVFEGERVYCLAQSR